MTTMTTAQLYTMQIVNNLVALLHYGSAFLMGCAAFHAMTPGVMLTPRNARALVFLLAVYVLTPPAYLINAALGLRQ